MIGNVIENKIIENMIIEFPVPYNWITEKYPKSSMHLMQHGNFKFTIKLKKFDLLSLFNKKKDWLSVQQSKNFSIKWAQIDTEIKITREEKKELFILRTQGLVINYCGKKYEIKPNIIYKIKYIDSANNTNVDTIVSINVDISNMIDELVDIINNMGSYIQA